MANDFETRGTEKRGTTDAGVESIVDKASALIEDKLPENLQTLLERYPLLALGGAAAAGFFLASLPLMPRRLLRAAVGTLVASYAKGSLSTYAGNIVRGRLDAARGTA